MLHDREQRVIAIFVMIFLLATVLRFYDLPLRPMHHDEASGHHTFTNDVFAMGKYTYDPVYHGPFLYHVAAMSYELFGINEVSNRLSTALFGLLLLFLVWPLRHWIGDAGMLLVAALIAVSPAQVYFSRFTLHDSFFDFFTLATMLSVLYYAEKQTWRRAALLGLAIGFLFTVKENAYFVAGILGFFALVELVLFSKEAGIQKKIKDAVTKVWNHRTHFYAGIVAFLIPFTTIYSSYFRHPKNIILAVTLPITKWVELATTWTGHFKPASYYLNLLGKYEFASIILGTIGLWICLKRFKTSTQHRLILTWAVLNTSLYFLMKYKTPWLTTHLMLPFAVAAGFGLPVLMQRWRKLDLTIVCCLLLAGSIVMCIYASFINYDNPSNKEFAYVQTGRGIFDMMSDLQANRPPHVRVIAQEYAWPLFWYLRQRGFSASHQQNIPAEINDTAILSIYQLNVTNYKIKEYNLGHHGRYYGYYRS